MKRSALILTLVLAGLAQAATTLGIRAPVGTASVAYDINARGQAVAVLETPKGRQRGVLIEGARITELLLPGGNESEVHAINDAGQVVGSAKDANGHWRAYLYTRADGMRELGTLGGKSSYGTAINAAGQVVGFADTPGGGYHAFLYDGRNLMDLGTLGGSLSQASGINRHGQVTGTSAVGRDQRHAFLYDPRSGMRDLGTLGGGSSAAAAINDAGMVVGAAETARGAWHAFVFDGQRMIDIGALLGEGDSFANGINNAGQVAGSWQLKDERRSFVWQAGKLTVYRGGQGLFLINAVNDQGLVIGAIRGTHFEAATMAVDAVPMEAAGLVPTLAPVLAGAMLLAGAIIVWRKRYRGLSWRSLRERR
ncbi:HAF repeat-containing protein [Massilia sp. TS11]|uniref:HAF repeat-containing protein n=1 Tax=Massilia sp. TS11 TaxID=2908003 RepID=UPI001EDADD90|nr:HAF repeat-containing protein [Massilia sp. TS11]MCG2586270.1 HAF repeat-containing protein [Massilia sp. TS11]